GDWGGKGRMDLVMGAPDASVQSKVNNGAAYLVFGGSQYCDTPPSSKVRFPVVDSNGTYYQNVTVIAGTAGAVCGKPAGMEVAIKRLSDGRYWDGKDWAPSQTWNSARLET